MMGYGALDSSTTKAFLFTQIPSSYKERSRVLIVLTGKKHRTVVAVPNQYRKTVQQQSSSISL